MEQHQRQDQYADGAAGEQHLGHRYTGGQAFLRAAEEDGDTVFLIEAEDFAQHSGCDQYQPQHHAAGHDQTRQVTQRDLVPDAFVHRLAERAVDHQQNRTLIHELQPTLVAPDPRADPASRDLPGNERQQQLHADLDDRIEGRAAVAVHVQQQGHQQRREEDPEQTGCGGAANRCRHVAARQRGKGNRRLHGGGQRTEVEHAHVQVGADHR
ncbi:hypothetical protein D3C71_693660 [compost metagenome]